MMGFNPISILIGTSSSIHLDGASQSQILESRATDVFMDRLEVSWQVLLDYTASICKEASDSPLPPLQSINHSIPLKDKNKVYSWRPSWCPDALRVNWIEKQNVYLWSGHWHMTSA